MPNEWSLSGMDVAADSSRSEMDSKHSRISLKGLQIWFCLAAFLLLPLRTFSTDPSEFFERKVRPILVDYCYPCHSGESVKIKGGLRLDSLQGLLRGGDLGPEIVPGDPKGSRLIQAVGYGNPDLQMPPKNKRLSERQVADLSSWILAGAHWPESIPAAQEKARIESVSTHSASGTHWSFLPVKRPAVPQVRSQGAIANPVDAFLQAELEVRGIMPNPPASHREQLRRLWFGVIGLPPAPEEIKTFEKESNLPDSWERRVDALLRRPEYGEKWARHWLDVARYAQSNGYERDGEKPLSWKYRDYVVRALNQDKPFDRFVRENLAGDELPDADFDSTIATGFQRLGVWDDEPDDKRMAEFDELDDIVSTTGTAFLGLTIGCARCHDHKFDPFPQRDYYQFLSFFKNIRLYENARYTLDSANYVPLEPRDKIEAWRKAQSDRIAGFEEQLKSASKTEMRKTLEARIKSEKESKPPFEWALAMREKATPPEATHLLVRGRPASPGPVVHPEFPAALGGGKPASLDASGRTSAGRRLALANWIASRSNPLTARVMVNRIWHHHFGQGIVKTTTDFGRAGSTPTHPALLDWLASELMDSGWSIKHVQRLILTSSAYRRSSRVSNPSAEASDPSNKLLWRQAMRRLDAEGMRDAILSTSGKMNQQMGGRGFFPHLAGEVLAGASRPGQDWEKVPASHECRRSIYAYVRRTMVAPVLESFDYNNTTSPLGERPVTTVAPQALHLLNDDFVQAQAAAFAARLRMESNRSRDAFIRRGFEIALGRSPTSEEFQRAAGFVERQQAAFAETRSRLVFKPDVPVSLLSGYRDQLAPRDFLLGPSSEWDYFRGRWSPPYEGIRTVDRARGPFALWNGLDFLDGSIEADLILDRSSEFASLLFRCGVAGDEQLGYEIVLDPRAQRIILRRHGKALIDVAEQAFPVPVAQPFHLRIELAGARIRVLSSGSSSQVMDVRDPQPILIKGRIGVRTWGAPFSLDHLTVSDGTDPRHVAGGGSLAGPWMDSEPWQPGDPQRKAEAAFCLLLLNLNEFVYID